MSIPPVEPVDRIPTELEALVQLLVSTFRHSQAAARKAVEEYKAPDALPAEK